MTLNYEKSHDLGHSGESGSDVDREDKEKYRKNSDADIWLLDVVYSRQHENDRYEEDEKKDI